MVKKLPPVHAGEVLREEFLKPKKPTPYAVAAAINVPGTRIERSTFENRTVWQYYCVDLRTVIRYAACRDKELRRQTYGRTFYWLRGSKHS